MLVEVKWDAPYSRDQINKYDRLLVGTSNAHLVFICARSRDWRSAKDNAPTTKHASFRAFKWEQIFTLLQAVPGACPFTKELIGFMTSHGLNPGEPITPGMTEAYLIAKPFMPRLERYANKLMHEFDWTFLPEAYRDPTKQDLRDRWGRIAIEYAPSWNGAISVGFLYDIGDHKVPFADGSKNGVDFFLRVEAYPNIAGRAEVNAAIQSKLPDLRSSGGVVRHDGDGISRNRHTLVILQKSLVDFLDGSEDEQLQRLYNQAAKWSNALFADGTVAATLSKLEKVTS